MRRTFTLVLSALLLAACGGAAASRAPDGTPSPTPLVVTPAAPTAPAGPAGDPTQPPAAPTASPSPGPTLGPTPASPPPTPWTRSAATLAWHRLGTIPISCDDCAVGTIDDSAVSGFVGFDDGYVVLEERGRAVWLSKDARSWKRIRLPLDRSRSNDDDANGRLGRAIATNGEQVVVVGGRSVPPCGLTEPGSTGGGPDCATAPIAWISDDGATWRVLYPQANGELVAVWPVADRGWMAALSEWYGEALGGRELWRSMDGVSWKRMRQRPPAQWEGYDRVPFGVTDAEGASLLAASERGSSKSRLARKGRVGAWDGVDTFPGRRAEVVAGTAPQEPGVGWILAGRGGLRWSCDDADCWGVPAVWSSADGVAWTTTTLPTGPGALPKDPEEDYPVQVTAVTSLVRSERGYVAVGAEADPWVGARHETWVSDDGVSWTRLPQRDVPQFDHGPGLVADGPAGVIGISGSSDDELVVWQLR